MRYELADLRKLVVSLEEDLQDRLKSDIELKDGLTAAWQEARDKDRTAHTFTAWFADYATQVAVAWVLTTVFVRFLEDNTLLAQVQLAGTGDAAHNADDSHQAYFKNHPTHSDTDYLLMVFNKLASMPAGELFGEVRNPLYRIRISGDAGMKLLSFFRELDPDTGELKREFGDAKRDTRFLGDLYQDLSESARKKYALLQTPDFVEAYILDYTLEPAIEAFGVDTVRFIDPTCGSGHFLLGGFHRLVEYKLKAGTPRARAVREALEATHGVDLNPFAVAIARFRLTIAALQELNPAQPPRFDESQALPIHTAVGDSLLHGSHITRFLTSTSKVVAQLNLDRFKWAPERYGTEDNDLVDHILGQQYHAVVGNPPYITPKDKAANDDYRELYHSCHRKYALVCPFYERFFQLAIGVEDEDQNKLFQAEKSTNTKAGFVGMIVANSFMKREFGKKLIEDIIPNTDLTHVIDTSGAYVPGHGTPTVILFGRNQAPQSDNLRAILGIRGEPQTPVDPAQGKVWRGIADHTNDADFENDYITVDDLETNLLHTHPWSLRGGGAMEAHIAMERSIKSRIGDLYAVGIGGMSNIDDVYVGSAKGFERNGVSTDFYRPLVIGEVIRDWNIKSSPDAIFPYGTQLELLSPTGKTLIFVWPYRTSMWARAVFSGGTYKEAGRPWWEWHQVTKSRYQTPLSITFAFVATHNHFVLDRGGKVFKQTAPVIKLPADATEDDHLGLLGLLNSSTACFWMKQVFFEKGGGGEHWSWRYEHDGTKVKEFPLVVRPLLLAKKMDDSAQRLTQLTPSTLAETSIPSADNLDKTHGDSEEAFATMVAVQEELDWKCYELYNLIGEGEAPLSKDLDGIPGIQLGERAFEIVMARKMEAGELETAWFTRHDSTPITQIPARWPTWYQDIVQARINLIENRRFIRLIEQPEYKRRWKRDSWEDQEQAALKDWLLNRLESPAYIPQADREGPGASEQPQLIRIADLADTASKDPDFMQVAERYAHDSNFVVEKLVADLIKHQSVPFLPSQRFKTKGLRKHAEWEKVWELQRREDAGEEVDIPVPPKYGGADFQNGPSWSLRGKLDVPKERFTLYKGLEHDGHEYVTWAGLNHLQRAKALAGFYYHAQNTFGWEPKRFIPLLAGLQDLLPWLKQWHNEPDDNGTRFGDFIEGMIDQAAREAGVTLEDIEATRIEE